jgi:hypothetical protein
MMERRAFLRGALAGAGLFAATRTLLSEQQCSQPTPTMTAMGVHPVEVCTAGVPSVTFKQAYQEKEAWCWAACISMVFDFYGHPVDQARIVKETWGVAANMPGSPAGILRDLNRRWTDDHGKNFVCQGDMLSVNLNTAIQDLQAGHPLIIGAIGHATVLTAVTCAVDTFTTQFTVQQVVVRDPWPGSGGRRLLSPMEWASINFAARIRLQDA